MLVLCLCCLWCFVMRFRPQSMRIYSPISLQNSNISHGQKIIVDWLLCLEVQILLDIQVFPVYELMLTCWDRCKTSAFLDLNLHEKIVCFFLHFSWISRRYFDKVTNLHLNAFLNELNDFYWVVSFSIFKDLRFDIKSLRIFFIFDWYCCCWTKRKLLAIFIECW